MAIFKNTFALSNIAFMAGIAICAFFTESATAYQCPPSGPWWGVEGLTDSAEVEMIDVQVPQAGLFRTTYYSTINYNLGPRGGYAGIQNNENRPLNNIFSIWDMNTDSANNVRCHVEDAAPTTYVGTFGGEGTGIHTHNDFGWVPGQWYTTLLRRWYDGDNQTRLGFWMYDYTNSKWTFYASMVTPEKDQNLVGNFSGFVENFWAQNGLDPRYMNLRQPWKLLTDMTWKKPSSWSAASDFKTTTGWNATSNGDQLTIYACGDYNAAATQLNLPYTTTKTKPDLDIPGVIDTAWMVYDLNAQKIRLNWRMNQAKAPQLKYSITLRSGGASGTILSQKDSLRPVSNYSFGINKTNVPNLYAEIQVQDIFGHTSNKYTVSWDPAKDSINRVFTISNSNVTSVSASDQESANPIALTLDGDSTTFWHSAWSSNNAPMPHTLIYKFNSAQNLSGILWMNRQDNNNGYSKNIKIYSGPSNGTWTDSMAVTLSSVSSWQNIKFVPKNSANYVKVVILNNFDTTNLAALAEIRFQSIDNSQISGTTTIQSQQITLADDGQYKWEGHTNFEWMLSESNGKVVRRGNEISTHQISSNLPAGIYWLQFYDKKTNEIASQMFTKK